VRRYGVEPSQIFVLSPFRDGADRIEEFCDEIKGLRGGTVHTAQGKEADVVILILGSNPNKPGSRGWASKRPNLVNVAVSRARQRLYVIGDFRTLKPPGPSSAAIRRNRGQAPVHDSPSGHAKLAPWRLENNTAPRVRADSRSQAATAKSHDARRRWNGAGMALTRKEVSAPNVAGA